MALSRSLLLTVLLSLGGLGSAASRNSSQGAYSLQDNYDSSSFFKGFDFFSAADPTNGFVKYHTAVDANAKSLAGYANNAIFLGSDSKVKTPAKPGRDSTRVVSKKSYTKGLFVADIAHAPENSCGVWPAFWSVGPNWPNSGEIDIFEGVNSAKANTMTLHTGPGCSFKKQGDCKGNQGCGANATDTKSFGAGFNAIGGGSYAMEWTSQAIKVWFFPRTAAMPQDVASGNPNPSTWPEPMIEFSGPGCDIDSHFKDHQLVFNTAFCGDWAGKQEVWSQDPVCSKLAPTCEEYVSNNPDAFKNAYWLINSVKVFSQGGAANQTASYPTKRGGLIKSRHFRN
ncbi:endo-1 3(4)-beta-glucanase [Apiospora aurea]|uniref:Endo-1 3(4)-beta-glucanase n=1 Tax=Apiospora aurea TaxID=335848 RepID=A0ABR1QE72_9PEZI